MQLKLVFFRCRRFVFVACCSASSFSCIFIRGVEVFERTEEAGAEAEAEAEAERERIRSIADVIFLEDEPAVGLGLVCC